MPGTVGRSGGDRKSGGMDRTPLDGLPTQPEWLSDAERAIWSELMDQLPDGLLRSVDCHRLAELCRALVDARECHAAYEKTRHLDYKESQAWLRACRQAEGVIDKLSARFGLTPKDRQSVKYEAKVKDDAEEWMNG